MSSSGRWVALVDFFDSQRLDTITMSRKWNNYLEDAHIFLVSKSFKPLQKNQRPLKSEDDEHHCGNVHRYIELS